MQDEVNTKVVAIAIKGGRITAEVLKKALAKFIEEIEKAEKQASQPKTYRGKQSIKHLFEQNAAISNIEGTDGNKMCIRDSSEIDMGSTFQPTALPYQQLVRSIN